MENRTNTTPPEPRYGFTGVFIPAALWTNRELAPLEKLLIGELDALSDEGRGCYATNAFLASSLGISEGGLANMLTRLREGGFIRSEIIDEKRRIFVLPVHPPMKGASSADEEGVHRPMNVNTRVKEKGKDTSALRSKAEEILALWAELCPSLPQARGLSEARLRAIGARLEEAKGELEPFRAIFKAVEASDFLSGRSGAWKASFDWVMQPRNWLKVSEGNYANNRGSFSGRKLGGADYAREQW